MSDPLAVDASLTIPADEISWVSVRASGPGGQHVNKVSTRIELRFNLAGSRAIDPALRARIEASAGSYLLADGTLLIRSDRTRDRLQNLDDARGKLVALILSVRHPPKRRRKTRPGRGAIERRIGEKKHQATKKQNRRLPD